MVRDGRLPRPLKFGDAMNSTVRFDRAEVEAAIARLPRRM
jgi:predicted DNA-binding transcriptional regulator AlpA